MNWDQSVERLSCDAQGATAARAGSAVRTRARSDMTTPGSEQLPNGLAVLDHEIRAALEVEIGGIQGHAHVMVDRGGQVPRTDGAAVDVSSVPIGRPDH